MGIEKYLETIGERGKNSKLEDLYLWHGHRRQILCKTRLGVLLEPEMMI